MCNLYRLFLVQFMSVYNESKYFSLQMQWQMTFLGNQVTLQKLPLKAIPNSSLGTS